MLPVELAAGWSIDLERGPDWLFVRLHGKEPFDGLGLDLADRVWKLLQQSFVHRVVLEMDDVPVLRSHLVAELVRLHKRVTTGGGVMRVCGLSASCYDVLRTTRLSNRFPPYRNRTEAVLGRMPHRPR